MFLYYCFYMTWKQQYSKYIKSSTWRHKREEAFAYHGRRCACCSSTKILCIHHISYHTYNNKGPGEELMHELVPLCQHHHRLVHDLIKEFVEHHKYDYKYNWDKASREAIDYLLHPPKILRKGRKTKKTRQKARKAFPNKKTRPKKIRKAPSKKRRELNKLNRGIGCAKGSNLRYLSPEEAGDD